VMTWWRATKVWSLWKYTACRSSLFCDVTQRGMIVIHRCFESNYRSHLRGVDLSK
jgi:hypothetical protein